jgi:hypothetical protein
VAEEHVQQQRDKRCPANPENYNDCLLLGSDPDEHTSEIGHDNQDFLLASILDNVTAADEALNVLSPYPPQPSM